MARREDVRHHPIEVTEHIASCNPQGLKALGLKAAIADMIPPRIVTHRMNFAVDLDREPTLKASEVDYVSVARVLPAKAEPIRPLPQLLPEDDFG